MLAQNQRADLDTNKRSVKESIVQSMLNYATGPRYTNKQGDGNKNKQWAHSQYHCGAIT